MFQMYHAIRIGSMTSGDGRPTNAVFGFTRALFDLYDREADYLLAVFDRAEPTFREKLDKEYKANRPPPPEDLLIQEGMIHDVLTAMNIPILSLAGYEADDILATLAVKGEAEGYEVFLCTSDKDCRQLITERVKILNLRKKEIIDADYVVNDWGVRPDQVIDFQALVGDSVDNIPGVAGWGAKTSAKYLQQFGSLDNLIANADKVEAKRARESLQKAIADGSLAISRQLVALATDVPLEWDWPRWKRQGWNNERLAALFQEFGFREFGNRVRLKMRPKAGKKKAQQPAFDLFSAIGESPDEDSATPTDQLADAPPDQWGSTEYRLINQAAEFEQFVDQLVQQPRFAFDLETTGLDPLRSEIVGIAFCWQSSSAFYLPLLGPEGETTLDSVTVFEALKPVFESPDVRKVNQNIKYEYLALRAHGIRLRGMAGDPMIADYLLHAGERTHNLDELTRKYFQHENITLAELIGKKGPKQKTAEQVPLVQMTDYACEDADAAWRLCELLESELEKAGLLGLYQSLEMPLVEVLAEMEYAGVRLDLTYLDTLAKEMGEQLAELETTAQRVAGREFNLNSPKQLREILFDEMNLRVGKRTGTTGEPSTDQETLERLAAQGHELPKILIEHRQLAKLVGTYVEALPRLVHPHSQRLHTSFNQTVTATGRLSSSDPNLQNIPARTDIGRQIRQAFIPQNEWAIVTADYSQIELRLLSHFSQDEQLIEAFRADADIHARVAAQIFGVSESEVSREQRRVAKMVNFGVIYGISAYGLAIRLGIERKQAGQFIDEYFAKYPRVLEYQDRLLAEAKRSGKVSTILGRYRSFQPNAIRTKSNYHNRMQGEREAINMQIQGSAADLLKQAMLQVYRRLVAEGRHSRMLLSVHDELVLETPAEELAQVVELLKSEMCNAIPLSVPLKVDVAVGPNWLEVSEI